MRGRFGTACRLDDHFYLLLTPPFRPTPAPYGSHPAAWPGGRRSLVIFPCCWFEGLGRCCPCICMLVGVPLVCVLLRSGLQERPALTSAFGRESRCWFLLDMRVQSLLFRVFVLPSGAPAPAWGQLPIVTLGRCTGAGAVSMRTARLVLCSSACASA